MIGLITAPPLETDVIAVVSSLTEIRSLRRYPLAPALRASKTRELSSCPVTMSTWQSSGGFLLLSRQGQYFPLMAGNLTSIKTTSRFRQEPPVSRRQRLHGG